jgi:FAD synthetase
MTDNQESQKKVMVFGTFDVFHAGHEAFLRQAKELGDWLIVVVARDNTVKKVKGSYPENKAKERLNNVKKCEYVDKAVLGNEDDKYKVIKKMRPEIIALGYDQFVFTYNLNKMIIDEAMNTEIVRLAPYKPEIYKSTIIKTSDGEEED